MNIVQLISNKKWSDDEYYAARAAHAARDAGYNSYAITRRFSAVADPFAREEMLIAAMPMSGISAILAPVRIASLLNKMEGPTVMHIHSLHIIALAAQARRLTRYPHNIKIVATSHRAKPGEQSPAAQRTYGELDALLFESEFAQREFLSTAPKIDLSNLHIVYPPVAPDPCYDEKPTTESIEIVFFGDITREKGLDTLIDALGQISHIEGHNAPQWHLTVLGSGTGREVMPIVRRARALDIDRHICWAGQVDDFAPFMRRANIAVIPSRAAESFGRAAFEAAVRGCAVIATENVAAGNLLANEQAALSVKPDSPSELARAISRLADDAALRKDLADRAFHFVADRLNADRFSRDLLAIYSAVAHKHGI